MQFSVKGALGSLIPLQLANGDRARCVARQGLKGGGRDRGEATIGALLRVECADGAAACGRRRAARPRDEGDADGRQDEFALRSRRGHSAAELPAHVLALLSRSNQITTRVRRAARRPLLLAGDDQGRQVRRRRGHQARGRGGDRAGAAAVPVGLQVLEDHNRAGGRRERVVEAVDLSEDGGGPLQGVADQSGVGVAQGALCEPIY